MLALSQFVAGDRLTGTTTAAATSNPIAATRQPAGNTSAPNTVWAAAGVETGIPTTRTRCTTGTGTSVIAAYTGTAATINTAITGCDANHYVELGSGTFNLSSGITFHTNSITLKGQGADSTKLIMTGAVGGCNYFVDAAISMCTGDQFYGDPNGDGSVVQADVQTTWTAAAQGTAALTFASVSGLAVNLPIVLDQQDDSSDGYPATGDLFVCGTSTCSSQGGGGQAARNGRAQTQIVKVTAINGSVVTVDPPLTLPNWRSGKSPGAYWNNNSNASWLHDSGVEALSIDITANGSSTSGIAMHTTTNCWVKGVRIITREASGSANLFPIMMIYGFHNTIRDNYFYGTSTTGTQRYTMDLINVSSSLFENNIIHAAGTGIVPNGPVIANVFGYNWQTGATFSTGGIILHGLTMMNLHEGNNQSNLRGDVIHAPHFFETAFRNLYDGETNNSAASRNMPGNAESYSRFWNFVGNVLGGPSSGASLYKKSCASESCGAGGPYDTYIYELGWGGDNSGVDVLDDGRVLATLMLWGNYDTVTAATRWCGNSSSTGWSTTCSSTSEVPTGITNYSNSVPSTEILPNSLYLSAKPAFFQSLTWPPIGPDVSSGAISGYANHANKIPARVCWESLSDDGSYPAGTVRVFNAVTCYGS